MRIKIFLLIALFCFVYTLGSAQQKTYQIKADTVRIYNSCDTAELVLENRTRGVLNGVLTNKGNGVTEFRKMVTKLNDSIFLVGGDTLRSTASSGKNIYNSNGTVTGNRTVSLDSHDIKFQNGASFLIANRNRPLVVSRTPMDSATFDILNNVSPTGAGTIPSGYTGLAVRGTGCDATIALISDTMGTCSESQTIDFTVLKPRSDAWLNNYDDNEASRYLLGRIQLQTVNSDPNISHLKFAIRSDTAFFNDGASLLFTPGASGGDTPWPVMEIGPAQRIGPGFHKKMPHVNVNGGLFVGFSRNWFYNSRNANDIILGVDDAPGNTQAFWDTRFSVYADSLPLKIFKLPNIQGSAFLTYSPTNTVAGNNVAFEYKDSVYEEIRNYISLHGLSTPSDFNLKENISYSQFDTDKLLGLSLKDFNYKTDKNKTTYTGLIAQELKAVIPELVSGKEGNYSIDYVKMVPYLLKALQEQNEIIVQLQKKETQDESAKASSDTMLLLQELQQQMAQQQQEILKLKEQLKQN